MIYDWVCFVKVYEWQYIFSFDSAESKYTHKAKKSSFESHNILRWNDHY